MIKEEDEEGRALRAGEDRWTKSESGKVGSKVRLLEVRI